MSISSWVYKNNEITDCFTCIARSQYRCTKHKKCI